MIAKSIILVMCSISVLAAPSNVSVVVVPLMKSQSELIPILSQSEDMETNGTYSFSYETGNGIKREESAYDKVLPPITRSSHRDNEKDDDDNNNEIHVQKGSYSYTAPDGTIISLRYVADENGFQPEGEHLPKAPTVNDAKEEKSKRNTEKAHSKEVNVSAAFEHKETKTAVSKLLSQSANVDKDSAVAETHTITKDATVKSESTENTKSATTYLPSTTDVSGTTEATETQENITNTNEIDHINEATTHESNNEISTPDTGMTSDSTATEVTTAASSS